MDLNQIQTWITSTDNSTKKRKQRAKKRHIPQLNLDTIINLIYNIAGGASCSGTNCLKSMWLLQGETEFDSSLDLHYCSTSCLNSRKKVKRTNNMHQDRINIIKLCLQEKYHLTDSPLHKPNTLAGAPLFKQIYETTNKQTLTSPSNIKSGKKLTGTSKITSWNMQGAINIDTAKQYLGKHKPAILALQETRLSPDNSNLFYHKDYANFSTSSDLMLFIRKDIKTSPANQPCDIIKIQGGNSFIHLANVYVRDNLLQSKDLNLLFSTYPNLLLIGDLNAKHIKISPHNKKIPYNSNGKQLYTYLQGLDDSALSPPPVTIHNLICSNEWTHMTEA